MINTNDYLEYMWFSENEKELKRKEQEKTRLEYDNIGGRRHGSLDLNDNSSTNAYKPQI